MSVEVEAPENMDETHYDIDPRMMIWKSMTASGENNKPLKAEEDLDELYHPSMDDLNAQIQNLVALPAAGIQAAPWQEDAQVKKHQEPEEDRDDIDHPGFSEVAPNEPQQDWDEVYRKAREELDVYLAPLMPGYEASKVVGESEVRVHLQPEEDMDDVYHKEPLQLIPYQDDTEVVVHVPSQRKHSEPEEDLDDLYHQ
ncbi:uncharacterized protein si:ch211-217g15.3 [Clinocottus analis]|uniref:uncharacterized protein si:ch211-217g15.3 n=1 Tax=Clinocottus analis TaxID=304258 RepID=UPI0035C12AC4